MEKIDKLIKLNLAKKAAEAKLEPYAGCPTDAELVEYCLGKAVKAKKEAAEKHLAGCFLCLDKVVSIHGGLKMKFKKPAKAGILSKNKWLIASIASFMLSFAFHPVFLQFLLAAGIFGGKWIFDSQNARLLVMIYDAWKKGSDKEASEIAETLKNRIPSLKK